MVENISDPLLVISYEDQKEGHRGSRSVCPL